MFFESGNGIITGQSPRFNPIKMIFTILLLVLVILSEANALSQVSDLASPVGASVQQETYNIEVDSRINVYRQDPIQLLVSASHYVDNMQLQIRSYKSAQPCSVANADNTDFSNDSKMIINTGVMTLKSVDQVTQQQIWAAYTQGIWSNIGFGRCAIEEITVDIYSGRVWSGRELMTPGRLLHQQSLTISIPKESLIRGTYGGISDNITTNPTLYLNSVHSLINFTFYLSTPAAGLNLALNTIRIQFINPDTKELCISQDIKSISFESTMEILLPFGNIMSWCSDPVGWNQYGAYNLEYIHQLVLPQNHSLAEFNVMAKSSISVNITFRSFFTQSHLSARNILTGYDSNIHGFPIEIYITDPVSFRIIPKEYINSIQCTFSLINVPFTNGFEYTHSHIIYNHKALGDYPNFYFQFHTDDNLKMEVKRIVPTLTMIDLANSIPLYRMQYCTVVSADKPYLYYPDPPVIPSTMLSVLPGNKLLGDIRLDTLGYGHPLTLRVSRVTSQDTLFYRSRKITMDAICIVNKATYILQDIQLYFSDPKDIDLSPFILEWDEFISILKINMSLPDDNTTIISHIYSITFKVLIASDTQSHYISDNSISPKYALCSDGYIGSFCQQPPEYSQCTLQYKALHECHGHGIVEYNPSTQQCNNACTCNSHDGSQFTGRECLIIPQCSPYRIASIDESNSQPENNTSIENNTLFKTNPSIEHTKLVANNNISLNIPSSWLNTILNACSERGKIELIEDSCDYECICDKGWTGTTCEKPIVCQDAYTNLKSCNNHGIVALNSLTGECNNTCTCDEGWFGEQCQKAVNCEYAKLSVGHECNAPNQQWVTYQIDDNECRAYCACTSPKYTTMALEPSCDNHGFYNYNYQNNQCDDKCTCLYSNYSDNTIEQACGPDKRCHPIYEATHMCNNRGTVYYNHSDKQCEIACTCYDDTLWTGTTCEQPVICKKQAQTRSCGFYGYIEHKTTDPTTNDDESCSSSCTCLGQWYGNSCEKCPIKCYNRSEYNIASRCQDDLNLTKPCNCAGNSTGRYCQYFSVITDITLRNRNLPSWLQSSKTDNKAYDFVEDLTISFMKLFSYNIDDNSLTNTGDISIPSIYMKNYISRFSIPLSSMSVKETSCMSPAGQLYNIPSALTFRVIINVGSSLGTISRDILAIQSRWNTLKSPPNELLPSIQQVLNKYGIDNITSEQCSNNTNDNDIDVDIDLSIPAEENSELEEGSTNASYNAKTSCEYIAYLSIVTILIIFWCNFIA